MNPSDLSDPAAFPTPGNSNPPAAAPVMAPALQTTQAFTAPVPSAVPSASPPGTGAEPERTQTLTPHSGPPETDALVAPEQPDLLLANAPKRQQVELELRKLGMSPVEIARLLNADAHSYNADEPAPIRPMAPSAPVLPSLPLPTPTPAKSKSNRETLESMQAYAAQLMAQKTAAQAQTIREVSLDLPALRESSLQEVRQAEPLLRDAAMLRRKEKFREAEAKVREALQYTPADAAALELLGDVLQGVARIDEALAAYKRALAADSKRSSAERKYGALLMLQQQWDMGDPEAVSKNSWFAIMLSLLLPGLGQFHNGEIGKGVAFLLIDALCIYLLAYSPWGFSGSHTLGFGLIGCITVTAIVYIVALVDTNMVARQKA